MADTLISINPLIDSDQKFKNLVSFVKVLLDRVHQLEDFSLGLQLIELGNRIYTETMDEKETPKLFLRYYMISHPIWMHTIIWEKALFKSIWDELWSNSPLKNMSWEQTEKYEQDLIYWRMVNLLTDLLYYDVDKDALKIMFSSFAHSNKLPEKLIHILMKKIERFGSE